jgi:diguanylate cyclase (GGDEF)-like protein/PAS domain S-box-containing protein
VRVQQEWAVVAKTDLLDVLKKLNSGVVVHAPDTSIVFANQRAAQLLGLSEAQMRGKTAFDPGWHFVDADGVPIRPEQYPVSRVAATGHSMHETVYGVVSPPRGAVTWLLVSAFPELGPQQELSRIVVDFHDINDLKHAQESLRASEHTYRTLFETIPQGVVYQDLTGHITSANPAAQRILGMTLDQMQGRKSTDPAWRAIQADGSPLPGKQHPSMQALRSLQPVMGVTMGVQVPGRGLVWMMVNATPLFSEGSLSGVYAIFEDITERKKLEAQIEQLAFFDPLTKLPNRRLFEDRMRQMLSAQKRTEGYGALMVIDLDNFKPLNDGYGHAAGDMLLVDVASRLVPCVRQSDTVARFGGDEFAVIVGNLDPDEVRASVQAHDIAEKIRAALAAPYVLRANPAEGAARIEYRCSASIGIALFRHGTEDTAEVFQRADHAMYQAKEAGRNACRLLTGPEPAA